MLRPTVLSDYESLSQHAANWLVDRLRERPDSLICLAAGSTPNRTYQLLAEAGTADQSLFQRCRLIKLDEWGGLAPHDPATCETQLRTALVEPLNLAEQYTAFNSQPDDPHAECERIANWLDENGPIDVCVLGLGVNGHLGFNEPAEALQPHAHVAELTQSSLAHAMLLQSSGRPTYGGLTLGMADLIRSRAVLLLVSGDSKRAALKRLLEGGIATSFPASMLQVHPKVLLLCDEAAAHGFVGRPT